MGAETNRTGLCSGKRTLRGKWLEVQGGDNCLTGHGPQGSSGHGKSLYLVASGKENWGRLSAEEGHPQTYTTPGCLEKGLDGQEWK